MGMSMSPVNESKELKPNWVDYSVAAARGGLNLVPVVGPLFAEIIGTTIPNQRIDRISEFAIELERKIDDMSEKAYRLSIEQSTIHGGT